MGRVFRTLDALPDLQVLEAWVTQLASVEDPLRERLLELLEDRQMTPRSECTACHSRT
jgi:hypothetical protein